MYWRTMPESTQSRGYRKADETSSLHFQDRVTFLKIIALAGFLCLDVGLNPADYPENITICKLS